MPNSLLNFNNAFKGIQNHTFKFIEEEIDDTPAAPTNTTNQQPNQPKNTTDDFFI